MEKEKQIRCDGEKTKYSSKCNTLIGFAFNDYKFVEKEENFDFKTKCRNCKKHIYIKFI